MTRTIETRTLETRTIETRTIETGTIETRTIETSASETGTIETRTIETLDVGRPPQMAGLCAQGVLDPAMIPRFRFIVELDSICLI